MSLKLAGEFCVMAMKNEAKFKEEVTCQFKIDVRNLTNFDSTTQKSQKFALQWASFEQSMLCLTQKKYRRVMFGSTEY